MAKIAVIFGKSSSGKDTLLEILLKEYPDIFVSIIPCTTRPKRDGEINGKEYHFFDDNGYFKYKEEGKIVESRSYDTEFGVWYYFNIDEKIYMDEKVIYLNIGTLDSYKSFCDYFGKDNIIPIYLDAPGDIRLIRSIYRLGENRKAKDIKEICRRYLTDEEDFSYSKIKKLNLSIKFDNTKDYLGDVIKYIKSYYPDPFII